jgi:hypothetical protein
MAVTSRTVSTALIASALLVLGRSAIAQVPAPEGADPRWIVSQFFLAPQWPDRARYYAGEMLSHYSRAGVVAEYGGRARPHTLRQLEGDDSRAIFAVEVEQDGRVADWYAYLTRYADGWRLTAVRTLALPLLYLEALDSLERAGPLPDSMGALLTTMRLATSTDSSLRARFGAWRSQLQAIADAFGRDSVRSIASAPAGLSAPTHHLRTLAVQLAALGFTGAWRDADVPGCVFLEIGGMSDNEVGFLFCQASSAPPDMTPQRFILVERVAPGWYLYRTT